MRPHSLPLATLVLATTLALSAAAAPIAWIGGDGDWADPANWDVGVPAAGDDVTLSPGTPVTVTHSAGTSSVTSLANDITLDVTGGILTTGAYTGGSDSTLRVSGAGTQFGATGTSAIDETNLEATGGAMLDLSNASTYDAGNGGRMFLADGGAIDLSGIVTLTGSSRRDFELDGRRARRRHDRSRRNDECRRRQRALRRRRCGQRDRSLERRLVRRYGRRARPLDARSQERRHRAAEPRAADHDPRLRRGARRRREHARHPAAHDARGQHRPGDRNQRDARSIGAREPRRQ